MAKPTTAARATICPGASANRSATKTPTLTRSEPTIRRRRSKRSTRGPNASPMTTAGRKSATSSALTHSGECVRSYTSTVSAITASQVPRPETVVARKSAGRTASDRGAGAGATDRSARRETVPGLGDARHHASEGSREELELLRSPHRDPNRLGCAEAVGRPDDRPLTQQPPETAASPPPARRRRSWPPRPAPARAPRRAARPPAPRGRGVQLAPPAQLAGVAEARERRLLRRGGHVEGPADLGDRGDDARRADCVADASPARP